MNLAKIHPRVVDEHDLDRLVDRIVLGLNQVGLETDSTEFGLFPDNAQIYFFHGNREYSIQLNLSKDDRGYAVLRRYL